MSDRPREYFDVLPDVPKAAAHASQGEQTDVPQGASSSLRKVVPAALESPPRPGVAGGRDAPLFERWTTAQDGAKVVVQVRDSRHVQLWTGRLGETTVLELSYEQARAVGVALLDGSTRVSRGGAA